jgi:hypothetical protein
VDIQVQETITRIIHMTIAIQNLVADKVAAIPEVSPANGVNQANTVLHKAGKVAAEEEVVPVVMIWDQGEDFPVLVLVEDILLKAVIQEVIMDKTHRNMAAPADIMEIMMRTTEISVEETIAEIVVKNMEEDPVQVMEIIQEE